MTFKLSTGQTLEPKYKGHDGKYLQVLAERKRSDGTFDIEMSEKTKNSTDKRVTKTVELYNFETNERHTAEDTYLLAENQDYQNPETIDTYMDGLFAGNARYTHKVEILFRIEEYSTRLFLEWRGNIGLIDFLSSLEDHIEDHLDEDELVEQGFKWDNPDDSSSKELAITIYNDKTGAVLSTEIELRELLSCVVSTRVIEFTESME